MSRDWLDCQHTTMHVARMFDNSLRDTHEVRKTRLRSGSRSPHCCFASTRKRIFNFMCCKWPRPFPAANTWWNEDSTSPALSSGEPFRSFQKGARHYAEENVSVIWGSYFVLSFYGSSFRGDSLTSTPIFDVRPSWKTTYEKCSHSSTSKHDDQASQNCKTIDGML